MRSERLSREKTSTVQDPPQKRGRTEAPLEYMQSGGGGKGGKKKVGATQAMMRGGPRHDRVLPGITEARDGGKHPGYQCKVSRRVTLAKAIEGDGVVQSLKDGDHWWIWGQQWE